VTPPFVIRLAALKWLLAILAETVQAVELRWLHADRVAVQVLPAALKSHPAIHAVQLQAAALKSLAAILVQLPFAAAHQSLTSSRV
jgi:hypothetical protein